ncbi:MAG: AAA family ATPase [Chloroflexi bacterium]|nr:AAA family ATPase [Chloroflexota bacterium]
MGSIGLREALDVTRAGRTVEATTSLGSLLQGTESGRLALRRAVEIASDICSALAAVHESGHVHRDIKPANILIDDNGHASLAGSGLLAVPGKRGGGPLMVGTALYMPPEQVVGEDIGPWSDLYSLGAVLYEMTTGRPPFIGDDTVAVVSQHLNIAPVAPSARNAELPAEVDDLILALLAKQPRRRAASALEVLRRLEAIRAGLESPQPARAQSREPRFGRSDWGRFVGRQEEFGQLRRAFEAAGTGTPPLVVLVGEPGMGKTRLADEFAVHAQLAGARVMKGRSTGEAGMPFMSFVRAFSQYAHSISDAELAAQLGDGAPELLALVPEWASRLADIPPAPRLDDDVERQRLFASIAGFLERAAADSSLLVVLDDTHWADEATVRLLDHAVRSLAHARVLFIATCREIELSDHTLLAQTLNRLGRDRLSTRVAMAGLSLPQVHQLVTLIGEQDVSEAFARFLLQQTQGNPFFIEEILKHLVEIGTLRYTGGRWVTDRDVRADVPVGIREVLDTRLSRLSEPCRQLLTAASAMGGGFSPGVLAAATAQDEEQVFELLDEAAAAHIVTEESDRGGPVFEFKHALIRQTLYSEMSPSRAIRLHRAIGAAIESTSGEDAPGRLPELAFHYWKAAARGADAGRAIDYLERAGAYSAGALAFEDAIDHYRRALGLVEAYGGADELRRCDLLLGLGDAQRRLGETKDARETLQQAAAIADRLGSAERLAHVALDLPSRRDPGIVDQRRAGLLSQALERVDAADVRLRARLTAKLAATLFWGPDPAMREQLSAQAISLAKESGDGLTLFEALDSRHFVLAAPGQLGERLAISAAMADLATSTGEAQLAFKAHYARLLDLWEAGEFAEGDAELQALELEASRLRRASYTWVLATARVLRAQMRGQFAEARALAHDARDLGRTTGGLVAFQMYTAQMFALNRAMGAAQDEPLIRRFVDESPEGIPVWRCGLTVLLAARDPAEARPHFEQLVTQGLAKLPRDPNFMTSIAYLSEAAAALGDVAAASELYDLFLPYDRRSVIVNTGVAYENCTSHYLGMLAAVARDWPRALRHFDEAVAFNTKAGALPYLAATNCELARTLMNRGHAGDGLRALGLINDAIKVGHEVGAGGPVAVAVALKARLQGLDAAGASVGDSIESLVATPISSLLRMDLERADDGTVTLLFTDIENSTAINERVGDEAWLELVREHNRLVREEIARHRGHEVKSMGDGFMVAFAATDLAIDFAIAVQRTFRGRNATAEVPIAVRIGIHTGEALREEGDFFGRDVNYAARTAACASGGEIVVSAATRQRIAGRPDITATERAPVALKGFDGLQTLYTCAPAG